MNVAKPRNPRWETECTIYEKEKYNNNALRNSRSYDNLHRANLKVSFQAFSLLIHYKIIMGGKKAYNGTCLYDVIYVLTAFSDGFIFACKK